MQHIDESVGHLGNREAKMSITPNKILWYFPLQKIIMHMYGTPSTIGYLTWYASNKSSDAKMQGPVDSP